ncbi:MAG: hypothetical protein Q8P07_03455 [bacterium]|nr:hypothetical protein [bacterium]
MAKNTIEISKKIEIIPSAGVANKPLKAPKKVWPAGSRPVEGNLIADISGLIWGDNKK